jgi:hypothetical protein
MRRINSHPMGFSTSNQQYTSCTAKLHPRSCTNKKASTQWQEVLVSELSTRQVTATARFRHEHGSVTFK